LRYTPQGTAVCSFGLAVNHRYATASGAAREETCFVDLDVWGQQALSCSTYLRKGAPALVEGRLRLDQWDDRETGKRRSRLCVQAERVQFVGPPLRGDFAVAPVSGADGVVAVGEPSGATSAGESEPARVRVQMPAFEPLPTDAGGAPGGLPF
jgi:single-strand DNA-binding protein